MEQQLPPPSREGLEYFAIPTGDHGAFGEARHISLFRRDTIQLVVQKPDGTRVVMSAEAFDAIPPVAVDVDGTIWLEEVALAAYANGERYWTIGDRV